METKQCDEEHHEERNIEAPSCKDYLFVMFKFSG
jgi:hypothetical protein